MIALEVVLPVLMLDLQIIDSKRFANNTNLYCSELMKNGTLWSSLVVVLTSSRYKGALLLLYTVDNHSGVG